MRLSASKQTWFLPEHENTFFRQYEAPEVASHFWNPVTVLAVVEMRGTSKKQIWIWSFLRNFAISGASAVKTKMET
jgi:hypothetical protein